MVDTRRHQQPDSPYVRESPHSPGILLDRLASEMEGFSSQAHQQLFSRNGFSSRTTLGQVCTTTFDSGIESSFMSVTSEHEALHRVFRHDPALYSRAVERALGIKL